MYHILKKVYDTSLLAFQFNVFVFNCNTLDPQKIYSLTDMLLLFHEICQLSRIIIMSRSDVFNSKYKHYKLSLQKNIIG